MIPLYWCTVALLALALVLALWQLGRLREWHHGYYGLALCCLPWAWARVVGLLLLVDDAMLQHVPQAWQAMHAQRPTPDRSPLHRAFVWLATRLLRRGVL